MAFVFMACNGDEIDALKKRVNTLEKITGSNEPIKGTLTTKDADNADYTQSATFYFKAGADDTHGMWDNGDGTFYVYVERFSDVEWYYGAWFYFTYEPATGEVTNANCGMYNQYSDRYINAYFYPSNGENTVDVTVNSFSETTGKISVSLEAVSTDAYGSNAFGGHGMTLDLSFKGTCQVFEGGL
jgi:hypothetical protein